MDMTFIPPATIVDPDQSAHTFCPSWIYTVCFLLSNNLMNLRANIVDPDL